MPPPFIGGETTERKTTLQTPQCGHCKSVGGAAQVISILLSKVAMSPSCFNIVQSEGCALLAVGIIMQ